MDGIFAADADRRRCRRLFRLVQALKAALVEQAHAPGCRTVNLMDGISGCALPLLRSAVSNGITDPLVQARHAVPPGTTGAREQFVADTALLTFQKDAMSRSATRMLRLSVCAGRHAGQRRVGLINGITGCSDTVFRWHLAREQFMIMLYRFAEYKAGCDGLALSITG